MVGFGHPGQLFIFFLFSSNIKTRMHFQLVPVRKSLEYTSWYTYSGTVTVEDLLIGTLTTWARSIILKCEKKKE